MYRVVTTNNAEVFRHLGSGPFKRLDLQHQVATSYQQALDAIRTTKPELAIIDVDLAGGSGYELCRLVKSDPELHNTHVMMVLAPMISRSALAALEACGCDDVLVVPIHPDDFYHHIAQVTGLPLRRDRRLGVTLQLFLQDPSPSGGGAGAPLDGTIENISGSGAGIVVQGSLAAGQTVTARLSHDGTTYPDLPASVAWAKPLPDGSVSAGLSFSNLPVKTLMLLDQLCLFDIARADDGVVVSMYGDFTEITNFGPLVERLARERTIDFYMRAVRYISSAGVRSWCEFLEGLAGKTYSFRHCSMAFALQAAMVPMAIGSGTVVSLEAPYRCEHCDREELRLLERRALLVDEGTISPPALSCAACGNDLEFDDVPSRYFAFLHS